MRLVTAALLAAALFWHGACRTPVTQSPPVSAGPPPGSEPANASEPIRLTVVGTTDIHGWVHPHRSILPDGQVLEEGGLSAFAGYLSILRAKQPGGVLLVDGGDLFQGTLASNLTEGEVVISAYNHLGYHAAAIGNHEFDYGPVGPISAATRPEHDPFGTLKARLAQAKFPLLAANIYDAKTGARPAWLPNDGTAMVEILGVKVGIIGLITPSTPSVTNPVNVASLRFGSLVPVTLEAAAKLRERGAEVVMVIAHAGGKCADHEDPKDLSSCDLQNGEIFELLQGVPEGSLDLVLAGHTHSELAKVVNGIPVVETRGLGKSFTLVELYVDPQTRKVLPERTGIGRNIPICARVDAQTGGCDTRVLRERPQAQLVPARYLGQQVVPDAALQRLIAPAMARVEVEQQRKLDLHAPQGMGRNYEAESALGNFLADTLRELERADVALLNPGGLRADLPAGELRYGDVYEVIPFDNTVAVITVTGEELKRLLHAAYGAHKGVFQVSGLKVTLSRCPGQGRLKKIALADGSPIKPDKRYRVVVPDFLARGGDGLGPVLSSLPPGRIDLGLERPLNFRDALVAHWQKQAAPLVPPPSGRIAFADNGARCNAGEIVGHH